MEMDPENFEKLTSQAQAEDRTRTAKVGLNENKWKQLENKFGN